MCIMRVCRSACQSTELEARGVPSAAHGLMPRGKGSTHSGRTLRAPPPAGAKPGRGASVAGRPMYPPSSDARAPCLVRAGALGFLGRASAAAVACPPPAGGMGRGGGGGSMASHVFDRARKLRPIDARGVPWDRDAPWMAASGAGGAARTVCVVARTSCGAPRAV